MFLSLPGKLISHLAARNFTGEWSQRQLVPNTYQNSRLPEEKQVLSINLTVCIVHSEPPWQFIEKALYQCRQLLHRKLECQVHESRKIRSGQTGDSKSEHWHFRNRELKWTGMGEFNSDDHYIYYCRIKSLRRNAVALTVNKRVQNAVLGCNLKNDRMISVHFQGKPFGITVIQVYAPTSNAEETEVERFYEDL